VTSSEFLNRYSEITHLVRVRTRQLRSPDGNGGISAWTRWEAWRGGGLSDGNRLENFDVISIRDCRRSYLAKFAGRVTVPPIARIPLSTDDFKDRGRVPAEDRSAR
jgi:hypothetical protein